MSERRRRRRPLIVIADVSGSMERYVEMLLYSLMLPAHRLGHLEAFVFSTRLTRITRQLRRRDPGQVGGGRQHVVDWSGGTRIGEAPTPSTSNGVGGCGPGGTGGADRPPTAGTGATPSCSARRWRSLPAASIGSCAGTRLPDARLRPETRMRTVLPYVDDLLQPPTPPTSPTSSGS